MTPRAPSEAGVRFCPLPVARLGQSACGGGRPGAVLSSTRCLARPPAGTRPGFWHLASDAGLALAAYRPAVSLSWVCPQALASSGLRLSSSLRLAPTPSRALRHRGLLAGTPFPVARAHSRRAVRSSGCVGSAHRSVGRAAGAFSWAFGLPRVSLWRWCACTVAQPHLRLRSPSRPARRDPQREAARGRRLSPLQTVEDQWRPWGLGGHACTWREGGAPSWQTELQGSSLPRGLPGSLGFLSTNGSHLHKRGIDLPAA
jgi:hypothetical protein